jgi:hypothetical protein
MVHQPLFLCYIETTVVHSGCLIMFTCAPPTHFNSIIWLNVQKGKALDKVEECNRGLFREEPDYLRLKSLVCVINNKPVY